MNINGHEYTQEEVFEALHYKGYVIVYYQYILTDETFPGGYEDFLIKTHCAIKDNEIPCEKNLWENVAIREFTKEFIKPKLV